MYSVIDPVFRWWNNDCLIIIRKKESDSISAENPAIHTSMLFEVQLRILIANVRAGKKKKVASAEKQRERQEITASPHNPLIRVDCCLNHHVLLRCCPGIVNLRVIERKSLPCRLGVEWNANMNNTASLTRCCNTTESF